MARSDAQRLVGDPGPRPTKRAGRRDWRYSIAGVTGCTAFRSRIAGLKPMFARNRSSASSASNAPREGHGGNPTRPAEAPGDQRERQPRRAAATGAARSCAPRRRPRCPDPGGRWAAGRRSPMPPRGRVRAVRAPACRRAPSRRSARQAITAQVASTSRRLRERRPPLAAQLVEAPAREQRQPEQDVDQQALVVRGAEAREAASRARRPGRRPRPSARRTARTRPTAIALARWASAQARPPPASASPRRRTSRG